jgi:hypothetical protein
LVLENSADRGRGNVQSIILFVADLHAGKQCVIGRVLQPTRGGFRFRRLECFTGRLIVGESLDHFNATSAPFVLDQSPDPSATCDRKQALLALFCLSSHSAMLPDEQQQLGRVSAR